MLRRGVLAAGFVIAGILLASSTVLGAQGPASEDGALSPFEAPKSSIQRDINALWNLILPISIVVGILVEALLLYAILKYRARGHLIKDSGEHERGHTKLEIAWTIPPAVILLIVGLLSTQTLGAIEEGPPRDFRVDVIASQFLFQFRYPDGSTSTDLAVEAGKVVDLNVTATDVIHSYAVPALGVKIDAVPGRINKYWLRADEPGNYQIQCMEYCGVGHAYMRSAVRAVEPRSTPNGWVPAGPTGPRTCAEATDVARSFTVRMLESGGNPWSADPGTLAFAGAERVCIEVQNPAGQNAPHNMTIISGTSGPKAAAFDPPLQPGQTGAFYAEGLAPGAYTYYCAVPGHRQLGMQGTLTVS